MTALMVFEEPHKKRHPREFNKEKEGKAPRMVCTVCWKPAVRYYLKKYDRDSNLIERRMVYEHRDEPPIRVWKYRGRQNKTYRRCNSGVVTEGLPFIEEKVATTTKPKVAKVSNLKFNDSVVEEEVRKVSLVSPVPLAVEPVEPDYKRMYFELLAKYEKMKRKLLGLTTEL